MWSFGSPELSASLPCQTSMETRTGDKPRYHVFEPSLIAAALNKEPGTNLSHLIFPCNGQADPINPEGQDPLTMYFKSKGRLDRLAARSWIDLIYIGCRATSHLWGTFTPYSI